MIGPARREPKRRNREKVVRRLQLEDECQELKTFTVLTRDACADLGWLHDRVPVILGAEEMKH